MPVENGDERKPSFKLPFPSVPPRQEPARSLITALGRLVIAWSSAEFFFSFFLTQLMGVPDLSSPEKVRRAATERVANLVADTNAVNAILFAVDSHKKRSEVVEAVAKARLGEQRINQETFDALVSLLVRLRGMAGRRNKYIHTAMSQHESGHYIFLDKELMITREGRTEKQKNPSIRLNNNRVRVEEIEILSDELSTWIGDVNRFLLTFEVKAWPTSDTEPA